MKITKFFFPIIFLALFFDKSAMLGQPTSASGQIFFKNQVVDFFGIKFEFVKNRSEDKEFQTVVYITNTTDKFIMFNLNDIYATGSVKEERTASASRKKIIVSPQNSKRVTVRVPGTNYTNTVALDFSKIQMTDKVENVYLLPDLNLTSNSVSEIGSIKFKFLKIKGDNSTDDLIVLGETYYSGNKFLSYFYNNIGVKTDDGKVYYNALKKTGDLYYDFGKNHEKNVFTFPVRFKEVRGKNLTMTFQNVFKEYTLETVEGPKCTFTLGTVEDYEAVRKAGKIDNIEEVDNDN